MAAGVPPAPLLLRCSRDVNAASSGGMSQGRTPLKTRAVIWLILSGLLGSVAPGGTVDLRLAQTIPLPGVEGRLDHLAIDLAGRRLFVCALGNDSLEVIDLQKDMRVRSIAGLGMPQGVAFIPVSHRLYVANDKAGLCQIYDGKSLTPLGNVDLGDDADNVRTDPVNGRVYVGYGNGGLAIIAAATGKLVGAVKLSAHPEAFVLEKNGPRIFVNLPDSQQVAVIDRTAAKVTASWKLDRAGGNFPIALNEANRRLFVGCRSPAVLVVLDIDTGNNIATVPISGDADDIFYDVQRHRLYVVTGAGNIDVIDQRDRDSYTMRGKVPTAPGARTGLFVPELNRLFVAVPHRGNQPAEVRCYDIAQ